MTIRVEKKQRNEAFQVIEGHLKKYRDYKVGIENMKRDLDFMMPDLTVNYSLAEGTKGVFLFHSDTEDCALDRIESPKALRLHEKIKRYQLIIDSIDGAIQELRDREREFVQLRYFKEYSVYGVCEKIGYGRSAVFDIRDGVKEKFLISLGNITTIYAA